jgi:RNA polymerase sigma-70 factor (ECF subfamily)
MKPDELYDRYGEKMYHYLALRLGSPEDAEDVLQETFCRLARYEVRWAFVRHPRAYIFKVLRNEANRHLARRIKQRAGDQVDIDEARGLASVIEEPADADAGLIVRALGELPDEQREVIVLKVLQDFSFKEIAAVCGLSINTAASRYRYGIEKLRSSMEGKV